MSVSTAPNEFEGRISPNKDWREIVAWVGDLPPMPNVASRAVSLIEDPNCSGAELSKILTADTALATRVLKIANSAMFARQREVTTLSQAVMIIGYKALKGIIVAATLRQLTTRFGPMEKMVWENAMCTAMCASSIAKDLKKGTSEEVFLLGLLHNLGQIILLCRKETAGEYERVLSLVKTTGCEYASAEQEIYGFSHSLLGALVAKKWNFSNEIGQVILHYRDPIEDETPETRVEEDTGIVQLADLCSHAAGVGSPEGYVVDKAAMVKLVQFVGYREKDPAAKVEELINRTKVDFEAQRSALGG